MELVWLCINVDSGPSVLPGAAGEMRSTAFVTDLPANNLVHQISIQLSYLGHSLDDVDIFFLYLSWYSLTIPLHCCFFSDYFIIRLVCLVKTGSGA